MYRRFGYNAYEISSVSNVHKKLKLRLVKKG